MRAAEGVTLLGILFNAESPTGLVFYLHGNAGALDSWGEIASTYTDLGYDLFMLDYRGFGKSEGRIGSQAQFYRDVQAAYTQLKASYPENTTIIIGYSIGTAAAAKLASTNHPRMLILQAPYYSLRDLLQRIAPVLDAILPGIVLKYQFRTYQFVRDTAAPIAIFHGDLDEVIPYESSLKLKKHLKLHDQFFTLTGQGHNGMNENTAYRTALGKLLAASGS